MWKWSLLLVGLAGCHRSRTELMIGVATDLKAPMVLDAAQLLVLGADDGVVQQQVSWDISGVPNEPFNLPGSYGVYSDGDEVRIDVELQGYKSGRMIVSRRAVLSLVEGKTLFLRMGLTAGCVDRTDCGPTESCVEGACIERALDSRQLPEFIPELTTTLTCASGAAYIDTSNGAPMPFSPDAMMCPADLCVEGVCRSPVPSDGTGPDGGTVVLVPHRYVMDAQRLPTTNTEAREFGLDLDGDQMVDNQLGQVLATFVSMGLDPRAALTTAIDRGTTIALVDLGTNDFTNTAQTRFTLYTGADPQPPPCNGGADPVCRRHLAGTGSFTVAPQSPVTPPLQGGIVNGTLTAGPGTLALPTVLFGPITLDLFAARAKLSAIGESTLMTGVIGGAITQSDVNTKLLPLWAQSFDATLKADCPGAPPSCGCPNGTTGDSLRGLFDVAPNDCTITASEVQNNSLIQSLLAPDITIGGQVGLSVGIGFSAVRGDFAPP